MPCSSPWWLFNSVSSNGCVPSSSKQLPRPMLPYGFTWPQWVNFVVLCKASEESAFNFVMFGVSVYAIHEPTHASVSKGLMLLEHTAIKALQPVTKTQQCTTEIKLCIMIACMLQSHVLYTKLSQIMNPQCMVIFYLNQLMWHNWA